MGIFDRISRLLRANVHHQIDKAEDPEKMLDQLIREAESAREAGHQQLVSVMAERNRIAAEAANEEKIAQRSFRQAEAAARKGKDDLAREALRRRHDAIEAAEVYSQQSEAQQLMVERLKTQLSHLDVRIRRMRQERETLVARKRIADAQKTFADAARQVSIQSIDGEFARQARRIRQEESIAAASVELYTDTLDGSLDALEDEQIEAQLVSLKLQIGNSAEALPDGSRAIPIDIHSMP